jgi:hypothetical protein
MNGWKYFRFLTGMSEVEKYVTEGTSNVPVVLVGRPQANRGKSTLFLVSTKPLGGPAKSCFVS